jgi:hypothetical protein
MRKPSRDGKCVKTLASVRGSGSYSNERHVHQFQLASFELDRSRRMVEKNAAAARIREINVRLVEIDNLIRRHQQALGLDESGAGASPAGAPHEAPSPKRRTLRY